MNQLARLRTAIRAWVGRWHVFERHSVALQHRSRFVRTGDRHLEPDALYGVRVHPVEANEIRVLQTRRNACAFKKAGRDQRFMKPEISADGCQVFGHGIWRADCSYPPALGSFGSCGPRVQSVTRRFRRETLHLWLAQSHAACAAHCAPDCTTTIFEPPPDQDTLTVPEREAIDELGSAKTPSSVTPV